MIWWGGGVLCEMDPKQMLIVCRTLLHILFLHRECIIVIVCVAQSINKILHLRFHETYFSRYWILHFYIIHSKKVLIGLLPSRA